MIVARGLRAAATAVRGHAAVGVPQAMGLVSGSALARGRRHALAAASDTSVSTVVVVPAASAQWSAVASDSTACSSTAELAWAMEALAVDRAGAGVLAARLTSAEQSSAESTSMAAAKLRFAGPPGMMAPYGTIGGAAADMIDLGLEVDNDEVIQAGSLLKKRRRKMNHQKYRKWKKKMRTVLRKKK